MARAADVIDCRRLWVLMEVPECVHKIFRVYIVADLFALISKYRIGPTADGALHQIGQKPM